MTDYAKNIQARFMSAMIIRLLPVKRGQLQ